MLVPRFVCFFCLCLGFLPSRLHLPNLPCAWGLSTMPMSGSSAFSAVPAIISSAFFATFAMPMPSSYLYLGLTSWFAMLMSGFCLFCFVCYGFICFFCCVCCTYIWVFRLLCCIRGGFICFIYFVYSSALYLFFRWRVNVSFLNSSLAISTNIDICNR